MIQRVTPFSVSTDLAQGFGVRGGSFVEVPMTHYHERDPWCAPLVIAGACEVFDFTQGYDPNRKLRHLYGLGRYGEDRKNMYTSDLFRLNDETRRTVHVGLDIGAAVGTPIFAPIDGVVWGRAILNDVGDFGGTIILKCPLDDDTSIYMLFGHLSHASVTLPGAAVKKGELIGWLGDKSENGGWNSHLHWQLSRLEPLKTDLPGAVAPARLDVASRIFPDPTEIFKLALAGWR